MLERRAEKKANAECLSFIYEPKVPKKLKKTICMGLACLLTVVTVLVGSSGNYYAATSNYQYDEWQTMMTSPICTLGNDIVKLNAYANKDYRWAVTSYKTASGYGQVTLNGMNVTVKMKSGNHALNINGSKNFTISNFRFTETNRYATFQIIMGYDSYPTIYSGYVKILN